MVEPATVLEPVEPSGGDGGGDEPEISALDAILLVASILNRIRQRGPLFNAAVERAIREELEKE